MANGWVGLDHARLDVLCALCLRAWEVEIEYASDDPPWAGMPGSPGALDRRYVGPEPEKWQWRRSVMDGPYHLARLYAAAVTEHLRTVAWILSEPTVAAASVLTLDTIARAGVEAAARGWWLLEPGIRPEERTGRWLADLVYSSDEGQEYVRKLGFEKSDAASMGIAPELWKCLRMVSELGLSWDRKRENPKVAGQVRPSNTAIVARLIGDTPYRRQRRAIYSLVSGSGHATLFGLLRRYRVTDLTMGPTQVLMPVPDQDAIDFAATSLLVAFVALMNRAVKQLGWSRCRIYLF